MRLSDWRLLPINVVAARLGCSVANVYKLIGSGQLVCLRTGVSKGYKVPEDELEAFIARRQAEYEARL